MRTATRRKRWLVLAPAATLALFTTAAHATSNTPAVTITVYNNAGYNQSPPLPDDTRIVGVTSDIDIWDNFDQQPLFNMWEDFAVRYTTHITTAFTGTVQFYAPADDGVRLYIDDQLVIDDWVDKGGGGSISAPVEFVAGVSQPVTLWFYENGGGAWVQLWWQIDGVMQRVPSDVFTAEPVVPTTTTTTEPTTTTTEPPTTTVEPTTTVQTTTTVESTTTTTVYLPPSTAIATTSTTINVPTTSQPTSTTSPIVTTTTVAATTLPPQTTTTQPVVVVDGRIDQNTAVSLATDSAVLQQLDSEQASKVFDAIDIDTLSDSEAAAIVDAVQDAPDAVREAFEDEIDIYSGKTDNYIPLGSLVNVATRRVLVVSVAFTIAAPITPSRRSF